MASVVWDLLKRLGAHQCSSHSHCHLTLNLPPKACTMDDAMSDRQEAERTNPALMKDSWISFGHHAYALVSSLLAQCGEAGEMLSSRERLMSAATCYFFLLMNDMLTKQEHGEHAEKYRLPTPTLRNTLHGLYLSIVCNLFPGLPGRDSLSLRSFQEKACEHHFSRAKSPFRGTPSLAQGVSRHIFNRCEPSGRHQIRSVILSRFRRPRQSSRTACKTQLGHLPLCPSGGHRKAS